MLTVDVFPAHAGVILAFSYDNADWSRLPRACGGDPIGVGDDKKIRRSSPRMRG